jgi:hypothetical protein
VRDGSPSTFTNIALTQVFAAQGPTPHLVSPEDNGTIVLGRLNNRGYLDVQITVGRGAVPGVVDLIVGDGPDDRPGELSVLHAEPMRPPMEPLGTDQPIESRDVGARLGRVGPHEREGG